MAVVNDNSNQGVFNMPSFNDAYEVLEDEIDDSRFEDDADFFEIDIDESIACDPDEVHHDMFHDFTDINEDDVPY